MLKNKKAVLFDMDGTLLNSMCLWSDIDYEFFQANHFDVDYELVKKDIEGSSMLETAQYFVKNFNMKETPEELMDKWNDMALEHYSTSVEEKPGATRFVHWLKANGYKIGVASSNSEVLIEAGLKTHNIYNEFDAIVSSHEVNKGKPAPDVYLEAARRIGVEPKDCLVFEDVYAGLMAGKTAGMTTCVIYDEYSKKDWEEKKKFADFYIQDFNEVLNLIDE